MATIQFYHPESNSYVDVDEADLDAFLASPDGGLCHPSKDLVVPAPVVPSFTVVVKEAIVEAVTAREEALVHAPAITDQTTADAVRAVVKNAKALWNEVEANRQQAKAPFLDACRKIDAAAAPLLERLAEVQTEGKNQQATYLIERDRRLAAEDAARRLAEVEALKDTSRPTAPLIAPVLVAPASAPLQRSPRVEVVNPALLPREYLMPDLARITADALMGKAIPGVKVHHESIIVAR